MFGTFVFTILLSIAGTRAADTGCDMTPGSALMNCLGSYASIPPSAPTTLSSTSDELQYLCAQYTKIANCWAQGLYCREWLPLQVEADKICALATMASSAVSTGEVTSFMTVVASTTSFVPASSPSSSTSGSSTGSSTSGSSSRGSSSPISSGFVTSTSSSSSATRTSASSSSSSVPTSSPTVIAITTVSPVTSAANMTNQIALSSVDALIDSVELEASNVVTSIWNDDSGTDIPVVTNNIGTKTEPTWTHFGASEVGSTGSSSGTQTTATGLAGSISSSIKAGSGARSTSISLFSLVLTALMAPTAIGLM